MGSRVAILQSYYIPWKGYFDLINRADEFVLYDHVQYTKNDWRNRNLIKTRQGPQWLTIPIARDYGQRIDEAVVANRDWARKHWSSIAQNYARAPYFEQYAEQFASAYEDCARESHLSRINFTLIRTVCAILGITTHFTWSTEYPVDGGPTERLVSICRLLEAAEYISGPAGRNYLDERLFEQAGITLTYMSYDRYPEYPQLFGPFEHRVSVIDVLFNTGPEAPKFVMAS